MLLETKIICALLVSFTTKFLMQVLKSGRNGHLARAAVALKAFNSETGNASENLQTNVKDTIHRNVSVTE